MEFDTAKFDIETKGYGRQMEKDVLGKKQTRESGRKLTYPHDTEFFDKL